ncbi:MAG: hypothetical protein RIQ94_1777 [Pseudomonadota bacterium]|jgi:hypothetical protein
MDVNTLLSKSVSFQTTAYTQISKEMTIGNVLNEIKSNKYLSQTTRLRNLLSDNKLESYNNHKKNLPAVTFCGTFNEKRKKELLKHYNSIIVLDIDKLDSEEFTRIYNTLLNECYVFSFWTSPSNKGIKGLVYLKYDFEINFSNIDYHHKSAFQQLQKYFKEKHNINLDESGSDSTRLCFLSCDNELKLNEKFISFQVQEVEIIKAIEVTDKKVIKYIRQSKKRDSLYNPLNRNNPYHRKTIQSIIKFLKKKNFSITYSYEQWYKVAIAIANSFTYELGEKYFLKLSEMDGDKFNKTECINILISIYENRKIYENKNNEISFDTICYFAVQKGFKKQLKEVSSEDGLGSSS